MLLVYFRNAIGDFIISLPTLYALSKLNLKLVVLNENPNLSKLLGRLSWLDGAFSAEERLNSNIIAIASLNSWCDELYLRDLAQKYKVDNLVFPYLKKCQIKFTWHDRIFTVAEQLGLKGTVLDYSSPCLLPYNETISNFYLSNNGPRPLVIFHFETKEEKMVSLAFIKRIMLAIKSKYPNAFFINISKSNPEPILDVSTISNLDLCTCFGILKIADYFVGVDSCFLHAADIYRVKSLGLYPKNQTPGLFEPRYTDFYYLNEGFEMNSNLEAIRQFLS